jgi:putative SOS response-associated peptidase YedK
MPSVRRSSGKSGFWTLAGSLGPMCGRFLSLSDPEQLAERFAVDEVRAEPLGHRYNVAPSLEVYAVIEREQHRRLGTLRWGFVPHWVRQLKGARQPINARVETLADSKMFGDAFRRRRCLLPADGFYEWQDRGDGGPKQPYLLSDPDGVPLAFAGIWSVWRDPAVDDAEPLFSTAIVTTAAHGAMEELHPRMPVVLPESLWADWLTADEAEAPHLLDAVASLGAPRLTATPISTLVNDVKNDGPALLEPSRVA